jgi:hypothetical protein
MTLSKIKHTVTMITREEGPKFLQFNDLASAERAFNEQRVKDENVATFLHNNTGELERTHCDC